MSCESRFITVVVRFKFNFINPQRHPRVMLVLSNGRGVGWVVCKLKSMTNINITKMDYYIDATWVVMVNNDTVDMHRMQ